MMVVRPVKASDLEALLELAVAAGSGMTTMPADAEQMRKKIHTSLVSFQNTIRYPGPESYFLVLEDTQKQRLVGTAAVYAYAGFGDTFYSYKIMPVDHVSAELGTHTLVHILQLSNEYAGCTEVGSLFLLPEYRNGINGKLLARSRYMLMAAFKPRFNKRVIAELRGFQNEQGQSPFWQHIGQRFFNMDFHQADTRCGLGLKQFIADLMPKYPIYIELLPESVQDVIGKPHPEGVGALKLLEKEGFSYQHVVDIFDAGPCVIAQLDTIKTIRKSQRVKIAGLDALSQSSTEPVIIAKAQHRDFQVVFQPVSVLEDGESIQISEQAADLLSVCVGDEVLISP